MPIDEIDDSNETVMVPAANFCAAFGGCADCKGVATVQMLSKLKFNLDERWEPHQQVFCNHWCHRVLRTP